MLEAMESSLNGGGGFSQLQSCGDSNEEEFSVLPCHTEVVVTGNNRTKLFLVVLHGVVKKVVGLGGWHWLVLTNGIEVKLQSNALSVIEAPTGNEEDDDLEFGNMQCNGSDMVSCFLSKFSAVEKIFCLLVSSSTRAVLCVRPLCLGWWCYAYHR
ncbi:uncharacterized protein LOC120169250 [Hibiscus syriacus]|uniref:uncharacterized protein LOC120169250 n=1 Tax=Hibiscus syriacus TaxID=106335 RepID=UPI00192109F5|nr:uncharacterized protein LOC120169250 [Hibiscus syriacus]